MTCPVSGPFTTTRATNASGSTVSGPAVGPSDLYRQVTAFVARSSVSRSSATGFRAQVLTTRVAKAPSPSGIQTAVCMRNPEGGQRCMAAA
ncbi:MAG: hypothetical protein ACK6DP_09640 [Gemmatimonas sp.]|uniref:hypothetical protein n=1 Tax=Gemmatimonas sp. TaxID=1962908 RepID=UPI00391FA0D8